MNIYARNSIYARLNEGLKNWDERWTLECLTVRCVGCRVRQSGEAARMPFPHKVTSPDTPGWSCGAFCAT